MHGGRNMFDCTVGQHICTLPPSALTLEYIANIQAVASVLEEAALPADYVRWDGRVPQCVCSVGVYCVVDALALQSQSLSSS